MWDIGAGLPVILQETAGGQTTYYVYGLDLIASVQGSTATYYLTDGLGSTTELANGGGSVTGAYRYDVFGTVRTHTGASTEWTFTGEQVDDSTTLEYLRARHYDMAAVRFVTQDPFAGFADAPQTLNRYAYVLNNPLRWMDPWGLCNVEGTAFGTPTPTPPGNYRVWGPVTPAGGCPNAHYLVPSSGGWFWGDVWGAYKDYYRHTPDYLVYQHVVRPAWEFATSRSPECYVTGGMELSGIAMLFAPPTAPVGRVISVAFAEPATTSCFAD